MSRKDFKSHPIIFVLIIFIYDVSVVLIKYLPAERSNLNKRSTPLDVWYRMETLFRHRFPRLDTGCRISISELNAMFKCSYRPRVRVLTGRGAGWYG